MKTPLLPGQPAPDFSALAIGGGYGEGTVVRLSDFAGRRLVLYFYPKDDTPGCTTQACALRDAWPDLSATGAAIFGVSVDGADSHQAFVAKHSLPFPLLSDPDHHLVDAFGVWVEKIRQGEKSMGTERTTFVIDGGGQIAAVLRAVVPADHLGLLQAALR
ncbi:MAG: peroxiredoxin [Chthoniobacterales bacterium]